MRLILFWMIFLSATPTQARMYQWVDPETDTPQLSGTPPTWYRSAEGGPRVIVFDRGQVIDDTGIRVQNPERERLRRDAFIQAEQDRETAKEKLLQAEQMKAVLGKKRGDSDASAQEELPVAAPSPGPAPRGADSGSADAGPTPEQLRALIEQWEQARTQNARSMLNGGPAPPPAAAPAP